MSSFPYPMLLEGSFSELCVDLRNAVGLRIQLFTSMEQSRTSPQSSTAGTWTLCEEATVWNRRDLGLTAMNPSLPVSCLLYLTFPYFSAPLDCPQGRRPKSLHFSGADRPPC
uniref:Deleted in lung and esophageal cancer protein 1 n=1 Tax=Steinernema glaseri TaxID=37863 RepID=A0A1I7YR83_9BILA